MGVQIIEEEKEVKKDNQIILSGTAYYDFNHFATYWKKWKSIIQSQGDPSRLREIFGEEPPENFDWTQYSIIRMPYELLPKGFMDADQVADLKQLYTLVFIKWSMVLVLREIAKVFSKDL